MKTHDMRTMLAICLSLLLAAFQAAQRPAVAAGRQAKPGALIRISSGNGPVGDFGADTASSGGQPYGNPHSIDTSAANAAPEAVYQHEIYGEDFSYVIPAPKPPQGRSYVVRLHFAELYDDGPDRRVMDVTINSRPALTHFDVYATAGTQFKAVVREFTNIMPDANGMIVIRFIAQPGHADRNAAINGVEVLAPGWTPVYKPPTYRFQNPKLPLQARVSDLISHMTLAEKVGQMLSDAPGIGRLDVPPYVWWNEALHGVARNGVATVFPQAIGLASAWDTDLHYQVATAISDEARAKYQDAIAHGQHGIYEGLTFWSPNINIFRDPRWGRGQETYGEDPYLTGSYGVAFIKGMQGNDPHYLKTVATIKHFAVHSGPEPLRHQFDARVSPYDLNDTYLPAFEKCVREAHPRSLMGAYNRVNGVPACANSFLLEETLRKRWGFDGYVVSDCGAISDISGGHKFARDNAEASADAVKAGCDLACDGAYRALGDAVKRGLIAEATLDRSLQRLFTARFQLGMFDPPASVPYTSIPISANDSPAHRELAARVARESMVLLRNEQNLLPLAKSVGSVAVIGPNAADATVLLGNYNGQPSHSVTVLDGIRAKLGPGTTVGYERGCDIKGMSKAGFAAAVALAQKSDVVITVMGLNQSVEGEEGEGGDRTELGLPGVQEELLKALAATGKPVVLVLLNGGAVAVNWAAEHLPAILEAWYPGEEGGTAVADVLYGDYNPGGRLPVTFYRSTDDLPPFTDYAMRNRTYRYYTGKPLYPFGYGLSYTQFQVSDLSVPHTLAKGKPLTVTATVRNTGTRAGDEVVQLYLRPHPAGTTLNGDPLPRLILGGFKRLSLASGASSKVTFTLSPHQLLLVDPKGERTVNPVTWELYVGGSQPGTTANGVAPSGGLTATVIVR
jgi:beta-glucosidase